MTCPVLRPELEQPLPARIARLPLDARGYPVPWFVDWIHGQPEFRAMDRKKWVRAVKERLCWVCGDPLGVHLVFPIGPMCGINRTTAEPPSHRDCALWSVRNCPFLSRPHMVRREDAFTEACAGNSAGEPIKRNPGVMLLWTTRTYTVWRDRQGKPLIEIGDPDAPLEWYSAGRPATREEVAASVDSGLPLLEDMADTETNVVRRAEGYVELARRHAWLEARYPA